LRVLIAEDDVNDRYLLGRAFETRARADEVAVEFVAAGGGLLARAARARPRSGRTRAARSARPRRSVARSA